MSPMSQVSLVSCRPFPVRDTRRRRLSVGEVQTYRDIALTKGHAGRGLLEAKKVFSAGAVEATHLVDVMRQARLDVLLRN